jgi:CopG family nickel-responsive transcriptional regulator
MKMEKISRFGVSLETSLLKKFDPLIKKLGYSSRSEAIRDLIRERLVAEEWSVGDAKTIGVLSLVYNHHIRELSEALNKIQHQNLDLIISVTHIHIDHHNCLEVIILKGKNRQIKEVSDELLSTRGVKHGKLIMTTTGSQID